MKVSSHGAPRSVEAEQGHFDSEFHRLSHDLRTPLNQISGFAELLLMDRDLSPANAGYARAILSGGETLKATVISHLDRAEEVIPDHTASHIADLVLNVALCAKAVRSSPRSPFRNAAKTLGHEVAMS